MTDLRSDGLGSSPSLSSGGDVTELTERLENLRTILIGCGWTIEGSPPATLLREAAEAFAAVSVDVAKLSTANAELEEALAVAVREVEHLRDRAVCNGCGADVTEAGACLNDCGDGEMIPASDLPAALRSMRTDRDCEQMRASDAEDEAAVAVRERDEARESDETSHWIAGEALRLQALAERERDGLQAKLGDGQPERRSPRTELDHTAGVP